ncbi:MAG TPA: sugar phosphate isomerase/epimerase [Planctomycetes bacterium]|nr:sugar phosphate isomerase/epimerase [Fuerstiella sp.]HIK94648.1 sugar phosphate isomerase/epimerase [Planctomycetota bacterium]
MPLPIHRRTFAGQAFTTAAGLVAAGTLSSKVAANVRQGQFTDRIRKAVKYHMVTEKLSALDKLKMLKDLGFDGVEPRTMLNPEDAAKVKELANASEAADLPIHGVINSSKPDIVSAIDQARIFGANSVLHVVRYDRKIGYMQNYRETQDIIRRAIDHAEKHEIQILIENVWASYLIEPLSMVRFVDELDSPWVQVYFDVGNVVRWGWPQHWIEVLGKRIGKLDIKEYDLNVAMNEGMRKGFGMPLGEGSVEWDKVRAELLKIDYLGWATAEVPGGDRNRLADIAAQMDRVLDL